MIVKKEMEKAVSEKDILEVIKKERGRYSPIHDTKAGSECFKEWHPKYTFVKASINNWKKKNWT